MDDIDVANDLAENLRNAEILRIRSEVSRVNMNEPCVECGDEIEAERLAVMPSARHCITCLRDMERKKKTHRSYS